MQRIRLQYDRATGARVWRYLRVCAFLLAVTGASAWWKVRQASADFDERSLQIGRQLASWKDPRAGTSTLRLNGQSLAITSVSSEASVKSILDRFSALCARDSGGVSEELAALAAHGKRIPEFVAPGRFGVFRAEKSPDEGVAACFARSGGGGFGELWRRLQLLVERADFAALGQLRYVFARRHQASSTSHVISVSSLGPLPLLQMFPEHGDGPGSDLFAGVRPLRSRRVISAELEGSSQQAVIYESEVGAAAALTAYDAMLETRGFERGDLAPLHDMLPGPVRVYFKADETVLLLGDERPAGGSMIATFRLADGGFVRLTP